MSEYKPKIYGFCAAGCKWETVHKDDFDRSATWVKESKDGDVWKLAPVKCYKINANIVSSAYDCAVSLTYLDNDVETTHEFTFTEFDAYRSYFYFEILSLTATATEITIVYEVNGNRYTETISGTAINITNAKLKVEDATSVYIFNDNACISIELGNGTKWYSHKLVINGTIGDFILRTNDPDPITADNLVSKIQAFLNTNSVMNFVNVETSFNSSLGSSIYYPPSFIKVAPSPVNSNIFYVYNNQSFNIQITSITDVVTEL